MGYPDYQDDQLSVGDRVDDPVIALSHSIKILASELLAAWRARVVSESLDSDGDLATDAVGKTLQLLRGCALDKDAIACHAA